jgi:uncharacterized RDD family membrane protein YckC
VQASLLRRSAALVYDALLGVALVMGAGAAYLAVGVALGAVDGAIPAGSTASHGLFVFVLLALFLYFGIFWTRAGYTPGMRPWHLRVQHVNGTGLNWSDAAKRFAAAGLSTLLFGLGFLWALVDPERLTLHDRLSDTRIIRDPSLR